MAGLFNGTRVQVLGTVGNNLLRVRILDGRSRHVGQTRLIARARFEYGRVIGERDIPFTRDQFPIDPAFFMSYNKAQGQSLHRCGLWNWDAQPFADNMLYTGCSRSTSKAGLKIFSSLGDLTVNKVDCQLLGVNPRATQPPPPPTAGVERAPSVASTPDIGAVRIDSRVTTRPATPAEPMEVHPPIPPSPTPTDVSMRTAPPDTPRPFTPMDVDQPAGTRFTFEDATPRPLFEETAPPQPPVEDESAAPAQPEQQDGVIETDLTLPPPPPPPPQQPNNQNPPNSPNGGAPGRLYMRL